MHLEEYKSYINNILKDKEYIIYLIYKLNIYIRYIIIVSGEDYAAKIYNTLLLLINKLNQKLPYNIKLLENDINISICYISDII